MTLVHSVYVRTHDTRNKLLDLVAAEKVTALSHSENLCQKAHMNRGKKGICRYYLRNTQINPKKLPIKIVPSAHP